MPTLGMFEYLNPTRIHFGEGSIGDAFNREISSLNADSVAIVTTASLVTSQAMKYLRSASPLLASAGVHTIGAHAPSEGVYRIARDIQKTGVEAVVALGGGSAMDAAKLAAQAARSFGDLDKLSIAMFEDRLVSSGVSMTLPVLCVPTTLSAAELFAGAGFSESGTNRKVAFYSRSMTPVAVFYDPVVTDDTPPPLWLSTGVRAIDHAFEGLVSPHSNPVSDQLCVSAVVRLFSHLGAIADGDNTRAVRLQCQVGAWESYTLPKQSAAGISHVLGKAIGSSFGIPHGITSCVLLPSVIRHYYAELPVAAQRLAPLGAALNLAASTDTATALSLAGAIQGLIAHLGLPTTLERYDLSDADLHQAATATAQLTGANAATLRTILDAVR